MEKKIKLATLFLFIVICICVGFSMYFKIFKKDRILVLYFSNDDKIQEIAKKIHKNIGGDIVEIKPLLDYSSDSKSWYDQAYDELTSSAYPEIKTKIPDLKKYDVVYLGYPIWFNDMPRIMYTLFKENDFSNTRIKPFYFSSSKQGLWTEGQIMIEEEKAKVQDGLMITSVNYDKELNKWLK